MRKQFRLMSGIVLSLAMMATAGYASRNDQRTELTVNEAIRVPGATLAPGDYTVELADTGADKRVVIFRDADTNKVLSMALTASAQQMDVPEDTKFTFYETPVGSPPALRTWFYPGDVSGHQFIYPETEGTDIAKQSRRYVPTVADADYQKMSATREGKMGEPMLVAVHDVNVYAISPQMEKSSFDDAVASNNQMDARSWRPDTFVRGAELPQSRLETQIRKEIVTLPFYSLWDHVEYQVSGNGAVTLMGSVYRPSMKKSIERVVKNVEGVSSVNNQLEVQPTSSNDDRIRRAAYRAIYGHSALQNYQLRAVPPIHIIVNNGNITLEGVVMNRMDKNIAGIQANSVPGAFKVENNLRVGS